MNLHITKSKNAESFYICKSYVKANGSTTSAIVRKLGTLEQLLVEHGPTRDDVITWAKNEAKAETEKYKKEKEAKTVLIPFHADRQLYYDKQTFFRGGYLFLQSVYYQLQMNKICRTLDVLGSECGLIQAEVYKNSHFLGKRNDKILYYDCSNYYFEIEQEDGNKEDGNKKYGKSKEHRPNPIIQMGLFMDGDGIPLAFSLFPGNANEQTSLKPLEKKVLGDFGCQKFIYCSNAGLGSESIREYNHMGERAQKMLDSGSTKKNRKNPNDPARFIGTMEVTEEGEAASVQHYLDENKISEEAQYDGLYAVCTDLLNDEVSDILKVSEGRWQIEECFRIMRTDFSARPVYLQDENRIKAHFLICFLSLMVYRFLERKLNSKYTCENLLDTLKAMNFAEIQEQGFIPLYQREAITDDLHEVCSFRTDYQFITKSKMKTIQKKVKGKNKLL